MTLSPRTLPSLLIVIRHMRISCLPLSSVLLLLLFSDTLISLYLGLRMYCTLSSIRNTRAHYLIHKLIYVGVIKGVTIAPVNVES